ncbi:MAG: hypothetical protein ACFFDJ_04805 [Candidatus Odinarchaeota archaeon]
MEAVQPKETMTALKCQSCNAPLTVSPDDVVIVCGFCGYTSTIEGEKIENHFVLEPTIDSADVREKITEWVGRGGKARVTEAILRFVPFWVESMHAYTHYEGYKKHTETEYYTDSQGKRRSRTKIEYEPITGDFNENRSVNVLCRRGATFYSQDELDKALHVTKREIKPFDYNTITEVESKPLFLNSELTDGDAYEIAETFIEQEHRSRADAKATEIWDCHSRIEKTGSYLLHIPHWLVRYQFGTETYRVGVDGHTKKVLKGEVPVSSAFRGAMYFISILFLLIGTVGTYFIAQLLPSDMTFLSLAMVVVSLAVAVVATNQTFKISSEKGD